MERGNDDLLAGGTLVGFKLSPEVRLGRGLKYVGLVHDPAGKARERQLLLCCRRSREKGEQEKAREQTGAHHPDPTRGHGVWCNRRLSDTIRAG